VQQQQEDAEEETAFPPAHAAMYPWVNKTPAVCGREAALSKRSHREYISNYARGALTSDDSTDPLMLGAVRENHNGDIVRSHIASLVNLIRTQKGGRKAQVLFRVAPHILYNLPKYTFLDLPPACVRCRCPQPVHAPVFALNTALFAHFFVSLRMPARMYMSRRANL